MGEWQGTLEITNKMWQNNKKKKNLQHFFLFQALWIICLSKHCLHGLVRFHSWVLVKLNWNQEKCLFKGRGNQKKMLKNITVYNWRGWYAVRQLSSRKLNERFPQASHSIFFLFVFWMIKSNLLSCFTK